MGSDVCLPSEVRRLLVLIVLTSLIGCASPAARRDATFGPVGVRISPTFSRVADGRLEADVELRDAYGDSVKGGGVVTLRLFSYDPKAPLVQGREIGTSAEYDLGTVAAQRRHWQSVSQTYLFDLRRDGVQDDRPYLLVASYEEPADRVLATTQPAGEQAQAFRVFDRAVLRPRPGAGG